MRTATRRGWGLSGPHSPDTNAKRAARESGEEVAMVDATGRVTVVSPDGRTRRLSERESVEVVREWCRAGWPALT